MLPRLIPIMLVAIGSALPARAAEIDRLFGHQITVEGENPERVLAVDGRRMLTDAIIFLDEVAVVDGVPVLIGSRSAGGNACEGTPFVMSFPKDGAVRLDGPIEECAAIVSNVEFQRILFSTGEVPGRATRQWQWTPKGGLTELAAVEFSPDSTKGWETLRERQIEHPSDVLRYGGIADHMANLLGQDLPAFEAIITGVGGGAFKGDDYVGSACTRHMCGDEEALVFLSAAERQAYIAWKPSGQKILVRPPVGQWPEKAKVELRNWASKWK
ncbi:hypothetical protein ACU5AY_05990 [Rhizobium sp. PAMB 3174]